MEALGVELQLLLTQIVNFTILLVVLTKLLYKPILKALKERRKKIEEGLAYAERAKLEEEKLTRKRDELLKETREEARVIVENAKKEGKTLKEDLVAEGRSEVEKLREKMEKELASKYEKLESQLAGKTVDIAAAMVSRLLPELVTGETQHKLIERELKKLDKDHARG
jgi:F-type H+-transporting ATPase subunit b